MKLFKEILLAAAILSFAAAVPASARTLDKECHPIPANYKTTDATRQGRLEAVSYTVKSYMTGKDIAKIAWVYLPYGYDNSEKDYNVFYIVHGGAETIDTYFGFNRDGKSDFKRIFDHTFENGEAEPCIIVNASWICDDYTGTLDAATKATEEFHNELVNNLIPTIDSRYRTIPSRDHRAFSGFSMGSACTWFQFLYNLGSIRYFFPMSGDCWTLERQGGMTKTAETVDLLVDAMKRQGYGPQDFLIWGMTGSDDIAQKAETAQMEEMLRRPEFSQDNVFYTVLPGGVHNDFFGFQYYYNALRNLWQE